MTRFAGKLLLVLGAPLMLTACATMGPPRPPSLELPKPPSDLRAVRKGDRVLLTWTAPSATTDRQTIRNLGATRICRRLEAKLTECGVPVGQASAQTGATQSNSPRKKTPTSYTDTLPAAILTDAPSSSITYAIEVLNPNGRGAGLSNQVRVPLTRTLPPPRDFSARVTGQGVVLSWTSDLPSAGSTESVSYLHRVYRRLETGQNWILAGELPAESGHRTLTDSSIEWEKTYEYRAETVTVVAQAGAPAVQVEGDDSPQVKVFADDVFPPAIPAGLQAVFSGPGQKPFIDLVWAPVPDVDLDGYNIYRREAGSAPVKLNGDLVTTPGYRDGNVAAGKAYLYSVSAVDVRGNESARSEEAGETVP